MRSVTAYAVCRVGQHNSQSIGMLWLLLSMNSCRRHVVPLSSRIAVVRSARITEYAQAFYIDHTILAPLSQ